MIVVLKLYQQKKTLLVTLLLINEYSEILLELLIHTLCLFIQLRMLDCKQSNFDSKYPVKFLGKEYYKL